MLTWVLEYVVGIAHRNFIYYGAVNERRVIPNGNIT